MALKIAERGLIPPFMVMDVMRAANEREAVGGDVIHLEVGQPSTAAPRGVLEAAIAAINSDVLGYTDALGIPLLRERIAEFYRQRYGCEVAIERIVVTTGSSGGFLLAFLSAFEVGDRVGLTSPAYPAYKNILRALGVEPVNIPVNADTRFQLVPEHLDQPGDPLDGLILASPSNPTGSMVPDETLLALVEACTDQGVRLISDEIYHGITFGWKPSTAAALSDDVFVINSFSKYFSMTGWRLGWMIVPEASLRAVECLAQNLFISPPTLSQLAACAVFDCTEELEANVARYASNRNLLLQELPRAGFTKLAPADGAFYIYADISNLANDSEEFCKRMLREIGVAATPGIDFDTQRGRHFIRFSIAGSTADMADAAQRLTSWFKN